MIGCHGDPTIADEIVSIEATLKRRREIGIRA
jgi:hypothetical protein